MYQAGGSPAGTPAAGPSSSGAYTVTSDSSDAFFSDDAPASESTAVVSASRNAVIAFGSSSDLYEVPADSSSVTLKNVPSNKHVYILKTNPTEKFISMSGEQYVSSVSGAGGAYPLSVISAVSDGDVSGSGERSQKVANPAMRLASMSRIQGPGGISLAAGESANPTPIDRTSSQLSLTAGRTKKSFWIEQNAEMTQFRKAEFVLAALGEYCNVWIPNVTGTVSISTAQMICAKFELTYRDIRDVFGAEEERIYYPEAGSFKLVPMQTLSDTELTASSSNRVNILVYDLAADGVTNGTTLTGYFHSKDYFPNAEDLAVITGGAFSYPAGASIMGCSNEGKYLYIDSHYADSNFNLAVSTIIHEFQHLIHWGSKVMKTGSLSPNWYNEMLSMMCEDLFCSKLGLTDEDTPLARLPLFNANWYAAGLEYRDGSGLQLLMSYAYPFAFGDWMMRNFGGKAVVSAMASNAGMGVPSIEQAAGRSMDELLKYFAASCAVPDSASLKGTGSSSFGSSPDNLKPLNLWQLYLQLPNSYSRNRTVRLYRFNGPVLLRYDSRTGMRPWGVKACYAGQSVGSDMTLSMGLDRPCPDMKMYILVSSSAPEDD